MPLTAADWLKANRPADRYTTIGDAIDMQEYAEYYHKLHPATDWDALEQKFNEWYHNTPQWGGSEDIFNFFKNEINGK